MTLVATAVIDSVDSTIDGDAVIIHAVAESDAISANTEGDVTQIEVLVHCPTDPGLQIGSTLTVSTHFVKSDPDAPKTPANAVGPEATEPEVADEPAPDSAPSTEDSTAPAVVDVPVEGAGTPAVGNGSAAVDASVPAAAGPGDDASAPAAADIPGTVDASTGLPAPEPQPTNADGSPYLPPADQVAAGEANTDTSVAADGSTQPNPGSEVTEGQAANPDYVAPLADATATPAPTEVPPVI